MTTRWRHALPALMLLALVALFFSLRLDRTVGFAQLAEARGMLRETVGRHGILGLAAFIGLYTATAALALPGGIILTIAGGFLFGAMTAGPAVVFSATSGATLLFLAARSVLNDFLRRRADGVIGRIRHGFQHSAWSYMLFLRLTPIIPFWLVNVGAALGGVPLKTFVCTTALGLLPATFIVAFAGENLDRLAAASVAALEACRAAGGTVCEAHLPWREILSPSMLLCLIALSLLALFPALVRGRRARRETPPATPP